MNLFATISIVSAITNIVLAIFLMNKGWGNPLRRIWSGAAISIAIWNLGGSVFSVISKSQYELALFYWQIAYTGIIFIPVFYTHFVFQFFNFKRKTFLTIIYTLAVIFLFFNWYNKSSLFLVDLKFMFGQFYWHDWTKSKSIIYLLFYISFYGFLLGYAFFLMLFNFKKTIGLRRSQLKYFIFSSIIGWLGGESNFLPDFGIYLYPCVNSLTAIYTILFAYAIIKHRLMDIRVALTRAGIFIFVYSLIFALPIWFGLKTQAWLWSIVLMGILSPVGIFAYSYLRQQVENVLFREQQRYQEAIKDLAKRMTQIKELDQLFLEVVAEVYSVVQPQFIALYTFSPSEKVYILSRHYLPKDYSFDKQISSDSQLITVLSKNKRPMLAENAGFVNLPLETLVVPFFSEGSIPGFLVLGQKVTKMMYSDSDFVTFDILSSQASLAIENAKHFQELKRSQLELLRQENLKFVQVLVKGLAHELLNPLTPLMHRIEDLEGESLLKLYDVYEKNRQKLEDEDSLKFKESLLGLRESTKSLKSNAQHIHLIIDTLNKIQKGDETTIGPVDIKSFFKDVVPMLALEVESHLQEAVTVTQDIANNIPPIKGNPTLLKQIFINLYKNSCEAMRNSLTKIINISCKINATNQSEVLIEFSDTGPGISSDTLTKIFTHGFTTKGTKGSGIGLSQCKAIIERFGGTIKIESGQNQGVRFIIKLPIWENTQINTDSK